MTRERRPDLDGVRGVAIALVLGGHAVAGPVAASGVTLFFGLSGYLITGLLLGERGRTGTVDLRRFYWRRLTRLGPPLLLAVAVVGLVQLAVGGLGMSTVLAPLTWTTNYVQLFGEDVLLLGHTWSLAVEEQFYLLWPLAFLVLMRRQRPALVLGLVVVALMVWRTVLLGLGGYEYAYMALETAGSSILVGCLVAVTAWRVRSNLLVLASMAVLVLIPVAGRFMDAQAWFWVPLLTTPAVAVIVAGARECPMLRWRWLGFLGLASYSLYLWHEPIAFLLVGEERMSLLGVALGSAAGLIAYLALERPLMRWRSRRHAHEPATTADPLRLAAERRGQEPVWWNGRSG